MGYKNKHLDNGLCTKNMNFHSPIFLQDYAVVIRFN